MTQSSNKFLRIAKRIGQKWRGLKASYPSTMLIIITTCIALTTFGILEAARDTFSFSEAEDEALDTALIMNKERGGPVAGVVLISDGRSNAGVEYTAGAAVARLAEIPVYLINLEEPGMVGASAWLDHSMSGRALTGR